jgi:hypothetical protein
LNIQKLGLPQKERALFIFPFRLQTDAEKLHPAGEPIWPHPLRCGPFAVPKYGFMARRLAAAATSTRETFGVARTFQSRKVVST